MSTPIEDRYKNIPKILKDLDIWLCYNEFTDKPKAPRDTRGALHSINGRLYSYKQCLDSIKSGINSGLGIVLKNNGIVCIDYDNVITDFVSDSKYGYTKAIFRDSDTENRILRDLQLIDSYTEISPSNKGIHIYLIANTSIDINTNKNGIEIYTNKFIRVSGNLFNEFLYNEIQEDKTASIEKIIKLYGLDSNSKKNTSDKVDAIKYNVVNKKSDTIYNHILKNKIKYSNKYDKKQILDSMFTSCKGHLLKKLYDNTITDAELLELKNKSSASDVDKAKIDTSNSGKSITLIMHLIHFSYGDIKLVKELFIKSKLCKDKYLLKNYDNHTKNIIECHFLPYAIINYKNYQE